MYVYIQIYTIPQPVESLNVRMVVNGEQKNEQVHEVFCPPRTLLLPLRKSYSLLLRCIHLCYYTRMRLCYDPSGLGQIELNLKRQFKKKEWPCSSPFSILLLIPFTTFIKFQHFSCLFLKDEFCIYDDAYIKNNEKSPTSKTSFSTFFFFEKNSFSTFQDYSTFFSGPIPLCSYHQCHIYIYICMYAIYYFFHFPHIFIFLYVIQ